MTAEAAGDIRLTHRAAARIEEIVAAEAPARYLRISVDGGGCSGFQYAFGLVSEIEADDTVVRQGNAAVVIDPLSVTYMSGAEIDYVDELIGAAFKIKNPLATASCGCGTSFSL